MWGALGAYVLTGFNVIKAARLYDAACAQHRATLATVRTVFALHNGGDREEAMQVLREASRQP